MNTNAAVKLCEEKVRLYLNWLSEPKSLINQTEVDRLQNEFDQSDDVMEKLKIAADLERAENPSAEAVRQGFMECALELSTAQNLTAAAFMRLGVPEADLGRAGFALDSSGEREVRKRLTLAEVIELVPNGPFSAKVLQDKSGASPMTVRRAIEKMVSEGHLVSIGTDPDYVSRGRAPLLYSRQ